MTFKISHGEVTFRELTRKLKKDAMKITLGNAGFDVTIQKADKIPMTNFLDMGDKIFELIVEKIVVDGKTYAYKDLEHLNKEKLFTDEDWDLCETKAQELFNTASVKKKST